MPISHYNTNLASEFYVVSALYRLGLDAYLTLGNKKSIDIVVRGADGRTISLDVKAVADKSDWWLHAHPIEARQSHFYLLLSYEGKIANLDVVPRVWIVPSADLAGMEVQAGGRHKTHYVARKRMLATGAGFEGAWNLLVEQASS